MDDSGFDTPDFLDALRRGDEPAYRRLVRRFHGPLVGVASGVIGSRAQAEEVVQEAWLSVFRNIGRFEGRSSLATWLFTIVLNRARSRLGSEARLVALPAVLDGSQPGERAVATGAFLPDGHWREAPGLWDELDPERILGGRQLWRHVQELLDGLPGGQRAVLILRDLEGRTAEEACALLEISPENQRVLLHRARGRIRKAIDALIGAEHPAPAPTPTPTPAPRRTGPPRAPGPLRRIVAALADRLASLVPPQEIAV
jgi:RNA polymerase sigma-70 factor (ECF subfamily)